MGIFQQTFSRGFAVPQPYLLRVNSVLEKISGFNQKQQGIGRPLGKKIGCIHSLIRK
jgi:hypothetical protein